MKHIYTGINIDIIYFHIYKNLHFNGLKMVQ